MSQDSFVEPVIIDNEYMSQLSYSSDMWENRLNAYAVYEQPDVPVCSIVVMGYNRIDKTKYCVECILANTSDVNYELILVDNGSSDGTSEYFQSVPFKDKKIICVKKNIGAAFPVQTIRNMYRGKYLIFVPNDVYVTKRWLSNLLKCMESDPKIGLAMPVSTNVSNLQEIQLSFSDMNDMQKKAEALNSSSPEKWEERMRLITVINIFSRCVIDTVGLVDPAYAHDFIEDDYAIRLRRAGFKLMLCKDTFVCHDHDFRSLAEKNARDFEDSLASGKSIYMHKYHGIDPWSDILNFEISLMSFLDRYDILYNEINTLSVDVKCGTPVLEIRNHLRRRGFTNVKSYAFTTDAKYYSDLQTVCDDVRCDRSEYIQDYFPINSIDIIVLGEPVNTYFTPIAFLQKLFAFLVPGGVLLFKLRNTDNCNSMLRSLGMGDISSDPSYPICITLDETHRAVSDFGAKDISIIRELFNYSDEDKRKIKEMVKKAKGSCSEDDVMRLSTNDYLFCIKK